VAVLVFELGDDMTLKTIKIIFAIWLLIVSIGYAEKSASWHYQKEQSWERTKSDFPASATSGLFLNRMVEIDEWAKRRDPELYSDSNKPYVIATMVQIEIDESKAKESAIAETMAYNEEAKVIPTSSWTRDLMFLALACFIAYIFYQIVRPAPGVDNPITRGRKWAAWSVAITTVLLLNLFFIKQDANTLGVWILAIGFTTPVAFVIGWIIGLFRYRKSKIELQQENPTDIVGVKDLKSHSKTDLLTTANPPPAPLAQHTTSTFMKNTEYDVTVPEGIDLENGYVEMHHNTQYSLILRNHRAIRCDAKVLIDGTHVGTWRIEKNGEIRIERPVHDTGHFTFFTVNTEEARIAGIAKNSENGLVSVTFTPEKIREYGGLECADLTDCEQGATGLTGESKQRFVSADEIEHDLARAFTIHLRLVSICQDIRPLAQRATPVPPSLD
jgi:hypothetical protein